MWFDTCLSLKSISPASVLFKMKTKILENLCIWLFVCADTNVCEIWATESIYIYIEIYLLYDLRSMFLFPSIFFVFLLILHWPGNDVSHFSIFKKIVRSGKCAKYLSLQMSTVTAKPQNYLSWSVQFVIIFLKKNKVIK